jgi:osmoprotectant transport system permease protein
MNETRGGSFNRSLPVFAGTAVAIASFLLLDFMSKRPSRISGASGISAFEILEPAEAAAVIGLNLCMAAAGLFLKPPARQKILLLLSCLSLFLYVFLAGRGAERVVADMPLARVFPSTGAWLGILGSAVVFSTESSTLPDRFFKSALSGLLLCALAALVFYGQLDGLSIMREYANRSGRFWQEGVAHVFLSASAVGVAVLVGVPLGFVAFTRSRFEKGIFAVTNSLQTIPSLALFGLLISPLAWLSRTYPFFASIGVRGTGSAPALIALSLYALLPVVRNTYTAFKIIDPAIIDAGKGMGMNRLQLFSTVELPVALPVILGGIRIAGVQTVGNTVVAALIGAGGFGQFIFQGLGEAAPDLILLGAISTVLLALAADGLLGALTGIARPGRRGREEVARP